MPLKTLKASYLFQSYCLRLLERGEWVKGGGGAVRSISHKPWEFHILIIINEFISTVLHLSMSQLFL